MNLVIRGLTFLVLKKTSLVLTCFALISLLCIISLGYTFRIQTNVAALLPEHNQPAQEFAKMMSLLGHQDTLFLLAEGEREELIDFAEELVSLLKDSPDLERIDYKAQQYFFPFFEKIVLSHFFVQFAPEEIDSLLKKLHPQAIEQKIAQNMKKLYSADPALATRINIDPLGLIEDFYRHLPAQKSPFDLESGYIFSKDQKALLIKMKGKFPATRLDRSLALVKNVENAIAKAKQTYSSIHVEISGGYNTAVASYYEFRRDLTLTLFTSVACVIFLLCFVFREWRLIYLAGIPLHLAILWTFALGSFLLGSMTSIALSFGAILAGLGVDFAIHLYNRFRIELTQHSLETAIERTFQSSTKNLFTAGFTTSCGFLVFYGTDFRGFSELGLLSGLGILICLFFMLLCFPCLLLISGKKKAFPPLRAGRWIVKTVHYPQLNFLLVIVLTFIAVYTIWGTSEKGVPFQSDIQILRPSNQAGFQEKLKAYFQETNVIYVIQKATTQDALLIQLHQLKEALQSLQKTRLISHYRSIVDFVPALETQQKIWEQFQARVQPKETVQALRTALEKYGFRTDPVPEFFSPFDPQKTTYAPYLKWLEEQLTQHKILSLATLEDPVLRPAKEPFLQESEKTFWAISYLFPLPALNDLQSRKRYVEELERRLPASCTLTGLPPLLLHLELFIFESFYQAVYGASFFILLFILLHFRSRFAFLALLPMCLGCLWMMATLKILGIPLNFMNIIVIPMVMGLGIDNGVYLVAHALESENLTRTLEETGVAIFLTSITTIAGFGSLIFANNAGLVSMGILASLGTLYCLFASLFFLPIFLQKITFPSTALPIKN